MKKRTQVSEERHIPVAATIADQNSTSEFGNDSMGAAPRQAASRLVRLLHREGFLNEQMLCERLKEHFRSSPSPEAEVEQVLHVFRQMLEGAPGDAANGARNTSTLMRSDPIPMAQGSHDTEPSMRPTIDPDFMRRVVLCWLDMVEESVEAFMTERAQIEDLIARIEASAQRLSPKMIDDLRRQAQGLLDVCMGDLDILRRQVSQITAAIGLRQPSPEASRPAALTHAGAPA